MNVVYYSLCTKQNYIPKKEYEEMYERIRAELMEELTNIYAETDKEEKKGGKSAETK